MNDFYCKAEEEGNVPCEEQCTYCFKLENIQQILLKKKTIMLINIMVFLFTNIKKLSIFVI